METLQDVYLICAHSGVNRESVENLLRERRPVLPITRKRIVEAMSALGFDTSKVPEHDLSPPKPTRRSAPAISCRPPAPCVEVKDRPTAVHAKTLHRCDVEDPLRVCAAPPPPQHASPRLPAGPTKPARAR